MSIIASVCAISATSRNMRGREGEREREKEETKKFSEPKRSVSVAAAAPKQIKFQLDKRTLLYRYQ